MTAIRTTATGPARRQNHHAPTPGAHAIRATRPTPSHTSLPHHTMARPALRNRATAIDPARRQNHHAPTPGAHAIRATRPTPSHESLPHRTMTRTALRNRATATRHTPRPTPNAL